MSIILEAVQFNHDPNHPDRSALNIRRNFTQSVRVPEWQRGLNFVAADSVAAYSIADVLGQPLAIHAKFTRVFPQIQAVQVRAVQPPPAWNNFLWPYPWLPSAGEYAYWQSLLLTQVNVLGEVSEQRVTFQQDGTSDFVPLILQNTRLASCGVGAQEITWCWQFRLAATDPWTEFQTTHHRVYTVLNTPRLPWVQSPPGFSNTQLPWTEALEVACGWARGARTGEEAAAAITGGVNRLGQGVLTYDCGLGATAYAFDYFLLSEFLELLRGEVGRGNRINCSDCAALVSTLANVLGADLWQSRMGGVFPGPLQFFPVNPVRTIGWPFWGLPCGTWPGWTFHEVAWKNHCASEDEVFDACLELDQCPPLHFPLLPTNLRFGRTGDGQYRDLLATPQGRPWCEPDPKTRRRRPVV